MENDMFFAPAVQGRRPAHLIIVSTALLLAACNTDVGSPPVRELTVPPSAASSSSLPHINNTNLPFPVGITADISAYDCSNNPGPQITFSALTVIGGMDVDLVFSNNLKGTHTYTTDATSITTVLQPGDEIVIPKQPVLGGV